MIRNWFSYLNLGLACTTVLFLLIAILLHLSRPTAIPIPDLTLEKSMLPKGAFTMEKEDYEAIGPPLMDLQFSPMSLQLPDLKRYLAYYGKNDRPDASIEQMLLHFSFSGSKEISSIPPETPLYLVYDKDKPGIKYLFSPDNQQTSLWIEATPQEKEAAINVAMKNEAGEIIRKPEKNAKFTVPEKEFRRLHRDTWKLGKWKADGTLLSRQKAKWHGQDLFFERHGGEEYKGTQGKQRIDFGEGEKTYSVFVDVGDALAWINNRWKEIEPGEESRQYVLLAVQQIEERLMKLNLWDEGGKAKVALNLLRSMDRMSLRNIEKAFKFVGARTRSQLMFEIDKERVLIGPKDWFLLVDKTWKKLTTPEQIDDYVERRTIGPLFVIDEISREEGRQVLLGTLFNATRTNMNAIEIPLQQGASPKISELKAEEEQSPEGMRIREIKENDGE